MQLTVTPARPIAPSLQRPEPLQPQGTQLVLPLSSTLLADPGSDPLPCRDGERRGRGYADRRIGSTLFDDLPPLASLPPHAQGHQRLVRAAVQKLEHTLSRAPRAGEVALQLGWSLATFHRRMVEAGAGGLRAGDPPVESLDAEHVADPPAERIRQAA
jgi:hypothetical protein